MDVDTVLHPAIKIAEDGFPVSPLISIMWGLGRFKLKKSQFGLDLLIDTKSSETRANFQEFQISKSVSRDRGTW